MRHEVRLANMAPLHHVTHRRQRRPAPCVFSKPTQKRADVPAGQPSSQMLSAVWSAVDLQLITKRTVMIDGTPTLPFEWRCALSPIIVSVKTLHRDFVEKPLNDLAINSYGELFKFVQNRRRHQHCCLNSGGCGLTRLNSSRTATYLSEHFCKR